VSLAPGARLGVYEILAPIGAGGMGEVYRARDTKLNRHVAIKVLPEAYAGDPERITRFHREAQAIAALNHANIAAIHDLAEAPSPFDQPASIVRFLILELVDGDTLAARLSRGALPVEDALQIARQILEALEAAHEKGICHRDLKPANVKVTPEGAVKVLDFGLAKFLTSAPAAANLTHSPTLTLGATVPGLILGTAAYMSPEQAKGIEADQRSDIFSFGCVLFEMLTGRQAFEGETVSEILASVLKTEADFALLPPRLNPRLVEVLRRCLEKNPKKRWHSAADVRVEIETVIGRGVVVEEPRAIEVRPGPRWKRAAVPIAAALVGSLAAGYGAWNLKPEPGRLTTRFSVTLPEGQNFTNTGRNVVALSPDGTNLVYVANQRLYLRSMDSLEARAIVGTEDRGGIANPVFSPDGQELAFFSTSASALKRVSIQGGSVVTICPAQNPFGMSWSEHGIVFGQSKGVMRVPATGGSPELVAPSGNGEMVSTPQILPDGRTVLFAVRKTTEDWDSGRIVVQSLGGGERKILVEGGAASYYLSTGHLVYAVSGTLRAVAFDLATLTVSGSQVAIVEGVRRSTLAGSNTPGTVHTSYSVAGTLAFVPGPVKLSTVGFDLALFDRKGGAEPLGLPLAAYSSPRVSPDGRFIAFERAGEREVSIWVYELSANRAAQQLTFGGNSRAPVWSPDGLSIALQSDREGDEAMYVQRADGSGTAERLSKPEAGLAHSPQSWSRDGAHLLFSVQKGNEFTLWSMTLRDRKVAPFGGVQAREAAFSPDGRWVAYQAREENFNAVYVEPFPRTGAKFLVSRPGGHPFWGSKSDEIVMNSGPGRSLVVGLATSPRVAFTKPAEFWRGGRIESNPLLTRRNADMMPDGRVVGVLDQTGMDADQREIVVVLNWHDELKRRVPVP
jgi:serine/threonine-protein kinase